MSPMIPYLLTPGPVTVPEFVLEAMAMPAVHPRTPEFRRLYAGLQPDLQYILGTKCPVLSFAGTGSTGMEITLRSIFRHGDKVLVVNNGKFSERWVSSGKVMGLEVFPLNIEWGHAASVEDVVSAAKKINGLTGVVVTHCETSTGAAFDLERAAKELRSLFPGLLILADCISTAAALHIRMDEWALDAVVTASQKGLMNPAGLTFVALSKQAQEKVETSAEDVSFHLWPYLRSHLEDNYPYTAPVHLLQGVAAAAAFIREETMTLRAARVAQISSLVKNELQGMGATLLPAARMESSDAVTVFTLPHHQTDEVRHLLKSQYGLQTAGGQGILKGKIIRVGHFGPIEETVTNKFLRAMREILKP